MLVFSLAFLFLSFYSLPLQTFSVLAGGHPLLPGECRGCVLVLLCFIDLRVHVRVGAHLYFRVGVCTGVDLHAVEG